MGIGDWRLGIGPIPNPQSPIPYNVYFCQIIKIQIKFIIYYKFYKL